jgi:hypothetical protein
MEAVRTSEMSAYSTETTRRYIPESSLRTRRRENLNLTWRSLLEWWAVLSGTYCADVSEELTASINKVIHHPEDVGSKFLWMSVSVYQTTWRNTSQGIIFNYSIQAITFYDHEGTDVFIQNRICKLSVRILN